MWFKLFTVGNNARFAAAVLTSDGGYLAVGHVTSPLGNFRPWLVKVDQKGEQQWQSIGPDAGFVQPASIVPAGDGGWILTGTAAVSGAQRLWWRRVGPTGDVQAEQTYTHPGGNVQAGLVRPTLDLGADERAGSASQHQATRRHTAHWRTPSPNATTVGNAGPAIGANLPTAGATSTGGKSAWPCPTAIAYSSF